MRLNPFKGDWDTGLDDEPDVILPGRPGYVPPDWPASPMPEAAKLAKADSRPPISDDDMAEIEASLSGVYDAGAADSSEIVGGGKNAAVAYARARAGELVGKRWDEGSQSWIDNPDSKWAITDTVRDTVRDKIARGIKQGQSTEDLTASLRETIGDDIPSRANTIARTEGREAYNHGAADNYRDMGVEQVEILDGSGLGDECDDENGEVVDIDEFLDRSAGRHPNCDIAAAPVLDDSGGGDIDAEVE